VSSAGRSCAARCGHAPGTVPGAWLEQALRAGVCAVVHPAQAPPVDVAVDLRRRQGRMAEQLLNRPKVGAAFEEVRRERVAQPVRMRRDPAQRARVQPPPADGEEQGVLGARSELRSRPLEVARKPPARLLAEGDDALLAALASHVYVLLLEIYVAEVEPDGFRAAQSSGIDELDERPVPQGQRAVALEPGELLVDLGRARRIG